MTRTLADAGAAFTALVPWGVSGTFIIGTLGLKNAGYILYSFYPLIVPLVSIFVGSVGIKSLRKEI